MPFIGSWLRSAKSANAVYFWCFLWHINLSDTFEGFFKRIRKLQNHGDYMVITLMPKWSLVYLENWNDSNMLFSPKNIVPQQYIELHHTNIWPRRFLAWIILCFFLCVWGDIKIHLNILYIYAIQNHSISINTLMFNNKKAPCVPWKKSPKSSTVEGTECPPKTPDPWGKWFESAHLRSPPAAKEPAVRFRGSKLVAGVGDLGFWRGTPK